MHADTMVRQDAAELPRGATAAPGERPDFLGFLEDEASEVALRGGLAELGLALKLRRGGVRAATRALRREPTPRVLLVDVAGLADAVDALEELAGVCTPDVRVLAIGDRGEIGFYRQLTQELGIAEYLPKPLTRNAVAELFGPHLRGVASAAEEGERRGGRIVAVCGTRGGAGATTVALNLALQVSETSHAHVALLDLHLRGGTAAMMLGVRPGTGLRVALEEPERVDALFLDRVAIPVTERLRLIAAEEPLDSLPAPSEEGMRQLLSLLRQRFNHVIIDMPMPPGAAERAALAAARSRILVLPPDLAGIRDTVAARRLVSSGGAPQVMTVLNRAGMPGTLKPALVAEGLGGPPDAVIPDLPRMLPRAANLGRPALRECAALRRALAPLTRELAATQPEGAARGSLLDRLLGRRAP